MLDLGISQIPMFIKVTDEHNHDVLVDIKDIYKVEKNAIISGISNGRKSSSSNNENSNRRYCTFIYFRSQNSLLVKEDVGTIEKKIAVKIEDVRNDIRYILHGNTIGV